MLPEKKKELIIWGISIIGVILVIIIMYNFAKFMRGLGESPTEEIVYDDPYPETYTYYGFALDEDGNYQLMGLDSEFLETKLGLRSFYSMDNLYYYDNHLVLYTDAINQINYNKEEETFMFYEQNSFFSHSTDVIITPSYYVFITDETLEYCLAPDCIEMTTVTDQLVDTTVLYTSDSLFYLLNDGVYEYNLEDKESTHIVLNEMRTFKLLATNEDYLLFKVDENYWVYQLDRKDTENISSNIDEENPYEFVSLQSNAMYYQTTDAEGNNILKRYSFLTDAVSNYTYNISKEEVTSSYTLGNYLLYAELSSDDTTRYVIIDLESEEVIKELENSYVVFAEVE